MKTLQGPPSQPESKPAADEPSLADMAGDCLQRVGRAQAIARMVADAHPEESHDDLYTCMQMVYEILKEGSGDLLDLEWDLREARRTQP
jgi:hypothetical protein